MTDTPRPSIEVSNASDDDVAVTVVLACYTEKRLDSIRAALESLRKQTLEPRRVVVAVDNNAALAKVLRGEFDWATVVENTGGRGASYARNRGVEAVDTEFVAFLDDDETAEPEWLRELTAPFSDQHVVGTGGAYEPAWETAKPIWFPDEFGWVVGGAYSGLPTETAPIRNVWSGNMAVRTADFRRVGGFRTDFGKQGTASQPEDTDLCIRVAEASGRHWMYVPSAVILHEVPASRSTFRFFVERCYSEGAGKAAMRANLDADSVDVEYDYVRTAAVAAVSRFAAFRWIQFQQAVAILIGLASAALGYAVSLARNLLKPKGANIITNTEVRRPALQVDFEMTNSLSEFIGSLSELRQYHYVRVLVRNRGRPVEIVQMPATETDIRARLTDYALPPGLEHSPSATGDSGVVDSADGTPKITVVICTRERPDDLLRALSSLKSQTYEHFRILVVDNAPTSGGTASTVAGLREQLDNLAYVMEPHPGLSQARNCALRHVDTDFVAWIDDDEVADEFWLTEIMRAFERYPDADAVSGSVVPAELETWPQWWFETYGGHTKGRGFVDAVFVGSDAAGQSPLYPLPAFGAGANMAMRTSALTRTGGFDVGLGAGTATFGGEDTLMFSQLLLAGSTVVYQPSALTRHYHRREPEALEKQMLGYGVGLTAFYTALLWSNWRLVVPLVALLPRAAIDLFGGRFSQATNGLPDDFPRRLVWIKRRGLLSGPVAYVRARRLASRRKV